MSEGDNNQTERLLDTIEVDAELTAVVQQKILPDKIAHRISEKIKEKNIQLTKTQLTLLVQKIQNALLNYAPSQAIHPESTEQKTPDGTAVQTSDMKKLIDAIEQLNIRMKVLENHQIEGVKGVSGPLVKTKDIRMVDQTAILEGSMQPLYRVPNDPESIVVIMKWLQYLVDRIGKNNLPDALGYYVDIGWISEDVRFDLLNYSKGITEGPTPSGVHPPQLPAKDHLQSLLFIQKIKGMQLDDRFLSKIERDMEKILKSIEGHQLKQ